MTDIFSERLTYSSAGTDSQFFVLGEQETDLIVAREEFTAEQMAEGIALPDGRTVTEAPGIRHSGLNLDGEKEWVTYLPAQLLGAGTLVLKAYHHVETEYVPVVAHGRPDGGADLTVFPLLQFTTRRGRLKQPKQPVRRARLPEEFCRAAVDPNTKVIHTDILMSAFDRLIEGEAKEEKSRKKKKKKR